MDALETMLRSGRSVAQVVAGAEMDPETLDAVGSAASPPVLLAGWLESGHLAEAVVFLSHALPMREGIWWAWLCARDAAGEAPAPEVAALLATIHDWIADPLEGHRRTAFAQGEEVGFGTPWGLAALAVFLSGGSLAPPSMEHVPPGELDAARSVGGAVALAAATASPDDPSVSFRDFISRGVQLADRIKLWTPEAGA
ncbi:hypothetical protein BH23GEM11_BH23GEM11_15870 [soil metagenome]